MDRDLCSGVRYFTGDYQVHKCRLGAALALNCSARHVATVRFAAPAYLRSAYPHACHSGMTPYGVHAHQLQGHEGCQQEPPREQNSHHPHSARSRSALE